MIKLIKESNDNKHNMLREDSIDDILEPQTYYIPDVWEDWKFDIAQAAERFGLSLDNLDYDDDSMTLIVTVDGYDRLGFEKYRKLYNWVVKNVYPEQDSYNESVEENEGYHNMKFIKESFYDKQYSIDNILAWLQDSGSKGARKITDFFGKGIILADDTESFLNSQPLEALQAFEKEIGIDFDSVFTGLDRDGYLESKKSKQTRRIQEQLSIDDKKFKEAVRFCNSTVEDLADELWRRYVDLEDAISCVKTFYENGKGRRSLLADIESHVNVGDLEDTIENVYFDNDEEMNMIRRQSGRV